MTRLTQYEREQIGYYHGLGKGVREIARLVRRDHSVVSRELKRNAGESLPYRADHAQCFSERRAKNTDKKKLVKQPKLREYVVERLKEGWSPEQIAGRLKAHPPQGMGGVTVSHEAIYHFIYEEEPYLYHKLRRKHWSRRKKGGRHSNKPVIPARTSISERPEQINQRVEIGHFESDSIVGKRHKQGLSVQYERTIQLVKLHRIRNFTATETLEAIQSTLAALPDGFVKSLTFDNGTENVLHEQTGVPTYFCDPYCAWQKGGVENVNGLIRQYIPKGTDLRQLSDQYLREIEHKLNTRPRKKLNYRTPKELLEEYKSGALKS